MEISVNRGLRKKNILEDFNNLFAGCMVHNFFQFFNDG